MKPKMKEKKERRNGHMTGMHGVYMAAAELTKRGMVVSPTSRSSFGADLLVTDQHFQKAWSVQVKTTMAGRSSAWSASTVGRSHLPHTST
jgi:hypothetical protein